MMLVTGATGSVGGAVANELLMAGAPVRVLARDASKASARFGERAEIAIGDLDRIETLPPALAGIERVFLMSAGDDPPRQYANLVEAAVRAGVKHVVMLSALGADREPPITMLRWFQQGEASLRQSGLAWTFVRPSGFMTNIVQWAATIRSQDAVFQPTGDGAIAYIDPRDIAAVSAAALMHPGYERRSLEITGPEPLSGAAVTATISAAIGRPLRFVDVSEEVARDGLRHSGMPADVVEALLEFLRDVKAGHTAQVTPVVAEVLGRQPHSFDDWLRENIDAFR